MVFDYPDWCKTHYTHWENLVSKYLKPEEPLTMIEVGCFEGRSTMWFADRLLNHPSSRIYCIDTWKGGEEIDRVKLPYDITKAMNNFFSNKNSHDRCNQMITHIASSEFGLSSLLYTCYKRANFIYLDGSHTQRDTLVDLTLSMLLIRPGGVILIDDYNNSMSTKDKLLRPKDAVDFVVKSFDNEVEFFVTLEQQAVIIRK